jgi:hypothetical protein
MGIGKAIACRLAEAGATVFIADTNFQKAQRGELPNTVAFQWSAEDVIPLAAREHAARTFDARDYAEQIGGEWQESSGGIYYNFSRELHLRKCSLDSRKPIWIGSDFNVDPMAWVFAQEVEGCLYVFDELYLHNANTPMALEVAWQRGVDLTRVKPSGVDGRIMRADVEAAPPAPTAASSDQVVPQPQAAASTQPPAQTAASSASAARLMNRPKRNDVGS